MIQLAKHSYSSREILRMKAEVNGKIKQIKSLLQSIELVGVTTPLQVESTLLNLEFKALEYKAVMFTRVKVAQSE